MVDLSVNIHHLKLANPVMTASGTFGYGVEFSDLVPLEEIGGIIVKGLHTGASRGQRLPAYGRDGERNAQLCGTAEQRCGLFL